MALTNFVLCCNNRWLFLVQGTASVVLAGLVASLKLPGGTLADHTFLFFGAGEVPPRFSIIKPLSFSI